MTDWMMNDLLDSIFDATACTEPEMWYREWTLFLVAYLERGTLRFVRLILLNTSDNLLYSCTGKGTFCIRGKAIVACRFENKVATGVRDDRLRIGRLEHEQHASTNHGERIKAVHSSVSGAVGDI